MFMGEVLTDMDFNNFANKIWENKPFVCIEVVFYLDLLL